MPLLDRRLLLWISIALLLVLIFFDGLRYMVEIWSTTEEYSHGFLIPLISAYLIWTKKEVFSRHQYSGSWVGIGVLVVGLLLWVLGQLSTLYVVIEYAFLIVLYGIALAFVGWRGIASIWASLVFLVFMIPLPNFILNNLSAQLQLISSKLGVAFIRACDISVFLEGNVIDLGTYKLQVAEACSGLNYLFPLMSLAFLCAYLFKGPTRRRRPISSLSSAAP